MLLTGFADMNAAMDAVNEGNIFRFLTKPCDKPVLVGAINTGLVQHHLITAEKELLENTLMGSIKVLTDVLSIASPEAFGRSLRIARYVRHFTDKFVLPSPWRFEAAAMLSQLGCVTLNSELVQAAYVGDRLSAEDQARFAVHPQAARDLLVHIPRMESVAWMIGQQLTKDTLKNTGEISDPHPEEILLGANILKLAVTFDNLRMRGLTDEEVIARLRFRRDEFGARLIDALEGIKSERARMELRKVAAQKLTTGMILQQGITTRSGTLMVPEGQEITPALLIKLENFSRAGLIDNEIMVLAPASF
jgi:response regulator RpfG family c-di-GMP phosphodiesterase